MKRTNKTILLFLLIVILSFTMISCSRGGENLPPIPNDNEGVPVVNINKNDIMTKISNGMIIGSERLEEQDTKFVTSEYTLHTGYINYTINYEANYASKRQNSEIYVKIFDNNYHVNRIFVYYKGGDLYIQSQDEKKSIIDFGSTSMFDLFYESITMLDMSDSLISPEISKLFDPNNVGTNIGALVEQSRIRYIKVTDTAESIEMSAVNLNYEQIKLQANRLIKETFSKFERKLDLLSMKYLGLRISDLAILEIQTLVGDLINVRLDNKGVETIIFNASGDMADGVNTFTLDMEITAKAGKRTIEIDPTESPFLNDYPEVEMGRFDYGGTLFVPFFDMTYDATLRTILSSTNNEINQVLFTIDSVSEEMGGMFYKDQMLYVDVTGMNQQLNGAIELEKLNLPKIKFDGIDLAQEITLLINDALKIVQGITGEDEYGENAELLQLVLDNLESDEATDTMTIRITKKLIEAMYGEDMDIVQILAKKIGVAPEVLAQIIGDDALDNAVLIFSYNVENNDIGLDLYNDDSLVFELRLSPIDPLPGDVITYPTSFNPDTFYWLEIPDNTILSIKGSLSMQEVSNVQFDKLFGALLGDITGVNTPYRLLSSEMLDFSVDIMQVFDYYENAQGQTERTIEQVMKIEIYKGGILQVGIYSSSDPDYILVDFNVPIGPIGQDRNGIPYAQRPLKYRIEKQKVKDGLDELLGEDNIFGMENIIDVLSRLLQSISDSESMLLRFVDSSLSFNLISDTVKDIIGIDHLNALIKARVKFAITPEEYLNMNMQESQFVTPNIRPLENKTFESIYTTQWHEFVYTYFGDDLMRLKLNFLEDSTKIISGKYYYQPRAKLLDQIVSYYVTIQDDANGIKIIDSVLDPDTPRNRNAALTEERALRIDPSINASLPPKIPVLYDDDTFGYIDYIIEGFDVSNITISGMEKDSFWLVIGKGSVAETRFYISVEVLGRVIIPMQEIIQGQLVYMTSNKGSPIVAEITIDPYTYAIRKADNPLWTPLPSILRLSFESLEGLTVGDIITVSNIQWDFDFNNIKYNGGVFFSHAMYNNLTIAIKINIKSKIVAYVRFVDSINTSLPIDDRPYTEAIGSYTVDILETSSYVFPTSSTEKQQLRLYFEDGTYRIIGTKDHNQDDAEFYKNYLPLVLRWKHETIDYSTLKLVGTKAPLGIEDKNINITTIGSDLFTIGDQRISLSINMPSRAEATIGNASSIFAITGYDKFSDGLYDFDNPQREMTTYTNASFEKNKELGSFFDFNPYNQKALPSIVYLDVIQGGEGRIQRKGYDVQWVESDTLIARHNLDGAGTLLNIDYILRNVSTEEEYLLVTGVLGDGNNTITIKMIVHNIDAIYQDITFEGMETNVTQITVDPYLNYTIPSLYTLMLKNGNEIVVPNVEWFLELQTGKEWMMQLDGKSYHWIYDFIEAKQQGANNTTLRTLVPLGYSMPTNDELEFFELIIERGEIPVDNRFVFAHTGGVFVIKSYIEATDSVIAQEVFLTINVIPRTVTTRNGTQTLDIYNNDESSPQEQYLFDTYMVESTTMLNRLLYLQEMNTVYDKTINEINRMLLNIRKDPQNVGLENVVIYSICYDLYMNTTTQSEKNALLGHYNTSYNVNINASTEEVKFYALQAYIQQKNNQINDAKVGVYFDDDPSTSTQKYNLSVMWTNLGDIINALESSDGAVQGIVLEGYIGYGQINQQRVSMPFKISRREIVSIRFNKMIGYDEGIIREEVRNGIYYYYKIGQTDNESIMSVDYRYVYIGDENEATSLIDYIMDSVILDNEIPQHQKSKTIYQRLYSHISTTEEDIFIMESIEESIQNEDSEIRYGQIIDEIKRVRNANIRSIFIDMQKPMGLVKQDAKGNKIFVAPSEFFEYALSQISVMFADGVEGYYAPRYSMGDGANAVLKRINFDKKILATDPTVYDVIKDPITGIHYAYVSIILTHLSAGSCKYPVTVNFKAVLDEKGVVDGYPLESEIEPFDENGKARFLQGYKLPDNITIVYNNSGAVTFGNINEWVIASPLSGFEEGETIGTIPVESINILNPSILDFSINLPCAQGEFTYHINFPQKYIGKTKYNAQTEDRRFSTLDIKKGIIEIDNIYDIYDSSMSLGFDTSKLPQTINPFAYEYGDVQYTFSDTPPIDTFFAITNNNSFDVEWKIVDDWINKKIDHTGTIIEENGVIIVAPILFATAKLYSYYLQPEAFGIPESAGQPRVLFEQTIELYIKVKPLENPQIEYDGLIDYIDNNNINFDPYDDPNNYGGNLVLPKDGLKVYFNDNILDVHTFDPRASLRYYLIMDDSSDISNAYLYDALMERTATTDIERFGYHKIHISEMIATYAERTGLSVAQASENVLASAYNSILMANNLTENDKEKQRKFLIDFSINLFEQHYNLSSLQAWQKLMETSHDIGMRIPIIKDYLIGIDTLSEDEIVQDLATLLRGYTELFDNATDEDKTKIINYYTRNFDNNRKSDIIAVLKGKDILTADITQIRNAIYQEGSLEDEIEIDAEIYDRLMAEISVNSRLDILRAEIEENVYAEHILSRTNLDKEEVGKALFFVVLTKECNSDEECFNVLSRSLALTIDNWSGAQDYTAARMWDIYLAHTIQRRSFQPILTLVEIYMSCSTNNSINRLKNIVVNQLINIFDYNDEYMLDYFEEESYYIAERLLSTVVDNISSQLEGWQRNRSKSEVWQQIVQSLDDDTILKRILNGETDAESTGQIDTKQIRAIAYERLMLSTYYSIFEARLFDLEQANEESEQELRRSMIYKALYDGSSLLHKALLLEIMMGAAKNVSYTQKETNLIQYTQAGHSILEIRNNVLYLYLLLPDGQRVDIVLNIFSREIKDVLIPNVITNQNGEEIITETKHLPNIYYIDPYNSETFRLPQQAEFIFETGYNLTLDIAEWTDYDPNIFYTRSDGGTNKIFYYKLTQNSYRGGSYVLNSYLTYGTGETAERQLFSIRIVVLNRTLKEAYSESYHFENPISGRMQDIPAELTNDMFVDFDVYYKSLIPTGYLYSDFGIPVVPQINWNKVSYNESGMSDADILVQGGFVNNIQGYLYYDNNLLTNTYNQLWQEIYDEYASITKPLAWSDFFETIIGGERVVKTLFAGAAAVQIKALDDQIYDDMIVDAYISAFEEANVDIRGKFSNLMITFRNNNFGLITDDASTEWYIVFYEDLATKSKKAMLTDIEQEVWSELYSSYVTQEIATLSTRRVDKWDALFAMTGIWSGQQESIAQGHLNDAYKLYKNYMLSITWNNLERLARASEAIVMQEIVDALRAIYGTTEQAIIRAWDFLKADDRIKGIIGETAQVQITAQSWTIKDIMNMADEVINEITFNAFTKTTNESEFKANFEVINTLLLERLEVILEQLTIEYSDEYRGEALQQLKIILMEKALNELQRIDNQNANLTGEARNLANWSALEIKRRAEATSPIDDTRASVENANAGIDQFERDDIVWARLLDGAGDWLDIMTACFNGTASFPATERYYYAVLAYRAKRIEVLTEDMTEAYQFVYDDESLSAWEKIDLSPPSYGETKGGLEDILMREVKKSAWYLLYYAYTQSDTEQNSMNSRLDSGDGSLMYSRGWDRYYANTTESRKTLMNTLLLFYYGYDKESLTYAGYGKVYIDIMENPERYGETVASMNYLYDAISKNMASEDNILIAVEMIKRLIINNDDISDLYEGYKDDLKRKEWLHLLERRQTSENITILTNLLPPNRIKGLAWQQIWQTKTVIAYNEYEIIQGLFDDVVLERMDEIKKKVYDKIYVEETIDNKNILDQLYWSTDKVDARRTLWNRLYDMSDSSQKTAMDVTYNIILREGGVPTLNAESRSWQRYISKNETSDEIKNFMTEMYEIYLGARTLEEYMIQTNAASTIHEDSIYDDFVLSYKKAIIWDEIFEESDTDTKNEMDDILLSMVTLFDGMNYDVQQIKSFAFDEYLSQLESEIEKDLINQRVINVELECEDPSELNSYKITQWNFFYTDSSRRIAMDDVLFIYNDNKVLALDSAQFLNILTPTEKQALKINIEDKKQDLIDLYFAEKTYDILYQNVEYTLTLQSLYNDAYQRHLTLLHEGVPNTRVIKREALQTFSKHNLSNQQAYFNNEIASMITANEGIFEGAAWDRYYALNEIQNEERANLMATILHNAVGTQIERLKKDAIDYLYNEMQQEAIQKVENTRQSIDNTIKKNAIWIENFGESIYSLKDIINNILLVDENNKTLKDLAWKEMTATLILNIDFAENMVVIRNNVISQSPPYYEIDMRAWNDLYASVNVDTKIVMDDILSLHAAGTEEERKSLAWHYLEEIFDGEDEVYNIMNVTKSVVYGENITLGETDLNALAYDRVTELYPEIGERLAEEAIKKIKSDAWQSYNDYYSDNTMMTKLLQEMYNVELYYHSNIAIDSMSVCWDRIVAMSQSIEDTLDTIDPRYSEEELRAFATDCVLDLLSGAERAVLWNAIDDVIIMVDESKNELWQEIIGENESFKRILEDRIAEVDEERNAIKNIAWQELIIILQNESSYLSQMNDTKNNIIVTYPEYDNDQIDYTSWLHLYNAGNQHIKAYMTLILSDNGFNNSILHLAWRHMYSYLEAEDIILDQMITVKNDIIDSNPTMEEEKINHYAYDDVYSRYPVIGERLFAEYTYIHKKMCFEYLQTYFASNNIMSEYLNRVYFENSSISITENYTNSWDSIVDMASNIEDAISSIDILLKEERAVVAMSIMLNYYGADNNDSRNVLWQAIKNKSRELTRQQIDSETYEILYTKSVRSEKLVLQGLLADAIDITGTTDTIVNQAKVIELYINYKQTDAVAFLNKASQEVFTLDFAQLSSTQKLQLYDSLHIAKISENFVLHTISKAEENWNNRKIDTAYGRMNIFWDQDALDEGGDIARVFVGNGYKAYDNVEEKVNYEENTFQKDNFLYKNRQITVEKLDFYGELDILAGDEVIDSRSYYNELVIDPLNPVIPQFADAYGQITGETPNVEINGQMYSYIGKVAVSYENRIYEYIYDEEGSIGENITAMAEPGIGYGIQNINIKVYYLDRQPIMYYANNQNYTIEQIDEILNLFPLSHDNLSGNKFMTLDPLNESIYDTVNKRYVLPKSLVALFTDSYADGIISTLFMNNIFNNRLDISDIEWNMFDASISLKGLAATNISINKYTAGEIVRNSSEQMNRDFWKIQLKVLDRNAERVIAVNQQGLGSIELSSIQLGILKSTNKIDPYNVMASFPENVRVEFVGGGDSKLLTNVVWQFAEGKGLEYLKLPGVITGSLGEGAMSIEAGFKCVSETIWITFPIQKRHIDISVGTEGGIRYLEGGTIYLVKDEDVMTQLKKYKSLFYNFAEHGETEDWSEVPLEFIANDVSQISTNNVGSYSIRGRLGELNDPNVIFKVVVIDPKLYALDSNNQLNSKVYYDSLSVAINSFGVRINGKEDEEGFLPNHFVQLEKTNENGNVEIGYNEFKIRSKYWDISRQKVVFTCEYIFIDDNDDNERLSGGSPGGTQLTFTINVPLKTFLYTQVDESMTFDIDSSDGTNILKLTLGQSLKMSDLPKAIMNKGTPNELELSLLWDLSTINVNKAGSYTLYGYYRDYTSSYMAKSKNLVVVIDKKEFKGSDEIRTLYALKQTYTGLHITVEPDIDDVLRENGSYSQLRLGREVIVEYLSEAKYLLGEFGDFRGTPFKNAGVYYARITINDYNTKGQMIYKLEILPIEINPEDIIFDYGEGASSVSVQIPNWPQDDAEKARLYYNQFRIYANQSLGANVPNRARAAAYDQLFDAINDIGQGALTNRYNAVLAANYPEYDTSDETVQLGMKIMVKAIVWEEITPLGVVNEQLVPDWPKNNVEKDYLLLDAKNALIDEGEENPDENIIMAQAYDILYDRVMPLGKVLLLDRWDYIILTRYPSYSEASDALKTSMMIEAKVIVWNEIVPTGLIDNPLINNWPTNIEEKEAYLDTEYILLLDQAYAGAEKEGFIKQAKARAFDELLLNIYSTAQEILQAKLERILLIDYPLYGTYAPEQKAIILVEAKALAWDGIIPGETVSEQSYVYDEKNHLPLITGLPQASIIGWPQTTDEKASLLGTAQNENASFTDIQAKARAYDNLLEAIYSNIYALQKLTAILDSVINENYPQYHESTTSYEDKQSILIEAKALAWEVRVLPGDTVEEIYYTFSYWYANMSNEGMIINSQPKDAGTYEITLVIDANENMNYRLRADAIIITTISIRRALIDQSFANEMEYRGTTIKPICNGLHDENGDLPQGVTITYHYTKDGREVSYIKDVGQYTFSATVNGGNNYPSWTIEDQVINITQKNLVIDVGRVKSGYLENIKELNSSITFEGIVGNDLPSMFGYLICDSAVSQKNMVGEYPIDFVGFKDTYNSEKIYYLNAVLPSDDVLALNPVLFGNYNITIVRGIYEIQKANESAITITSQAELNIAYDNLHEGSSVIWYVAPGEYETFIIDKNVGITLIGCYDVNAVLRDYSTIEDSHEAMMQKVKNDANDIVTIFESIIINRGAITLDIIKINGKINESAIYLGQKATSLELKRSYLVHTEVFGEGGSSIVQNTTGINTSPSFKGLIRLDRIYIEGFTAAVYVKNGNELQIVNSRLNKNNAGVVSFGGNVHMEGSRFEFTTGNAVYLELIDFTAINCSFISNEVAIKSLNTNTYDLWLENKFSKNVEDIVSL